jgi:hypothetical protein
VRDPEWIGRMERQIDSRVNLPPATFRCVTAEDVVRLVRREIAAGPVFHNLHGITSANLDSLLVPPYEIRVDPEDGSQPRPMWVVLAERRPADVAYLVVFDPADRTWGVAEPDGRGAFRLVVAAETFARALSAM